MKKDFFSSQFKVFDKKKINLRNFILVSILFHFTLVLATLFLSYYHVNKKHEQIEVTLVSPEDLSPKTPDVIAKQIVETDSQFANNKLDDKAKYQSEKSNTVDKETKAKIGEQFKNSMNQGAKTKQAEKGQKKTAAQMLAQTFDPYAALVKKTEAQENKDFAKGQTGAKAGDTSTTNDKLDATEDLITKLNTREFKYYGYYHRIKIQLNQWWQPKVREKVTKMVSQGRKVATAENKITRLIIILNDAGTLVKVQVLAESGVRDLDDAAIEAFRSAAPFPNPPKGIVEPDGTVRIHWDFVVES